MAYARGFYGITRDLHLYIGLFLSPIVIVFGVSTIILNHRWEPEPVVKGTRTRPVQLEEGLKDREQAAQLMKQLDISGDLQVVRRPPPTRNLEFNVVRPGSATRVEVKKEGVAEITNRSTGTTGSAIFLHVRPGPHKPRSMIVWSVLVVWTWLADATVYVLFFLSITGIYLWATIRAERKLGLIMLGGGVLTLALIMAGFYYL
jgi:hypothetical protein